MHTLKKSPILFIGHGSPMNAIADNSFTRSLAELQKIYPTPKAIVCVSAHWITKGTWVTHMAHPRTIHDFGGFPEELFAIQYPAPGSPEIADLICTLIPQVSVDDQNWGLDHGAWSVLRHVYPQANIPVVQLSLDLAQPPQYHYELGKKLKELRNHGVLIIGSGNVVHNLRKIKWEENAEPYDWALEFDAWVKENLLQKNYEALIKKFNETPSGKLSIPTTEHYLPLLYTLGASDENDALNFEFEGIQNGSISMLTLSFSSKE